MNKLIGIVTILSGVLLVSCGDDKKKEDGGDEASAVVSLDNESQRFSYAMGLTNGSSVRKSVADPQYGIEGKINFQRTLEGCSDAFSEDYEIPLEELQTVAGNFMEKVDSKGEIDKELSDDFSYFIGVNVAKTILNQLQMLQSDSLLDEKAFRAGLSDGLLEKKAKMTEEDATELVQNFFRDKQMAQQQQANEEAEANYAINKQLGDAFLEENKKRPEVKTTESGLQYEILKKGNGPKPAATDVVLASYKGTLIDGTEFDASPEGEPISFPLNGVIAGWTEALQLMSVGSKWKLYIPEDLAYGKFPRPGGPIKAGMTLIFEVELVGIE